MTEKEKAALGLLYNNNYDKELIEERLDCQTMCMNTISFRHVKWESASN